MATFGFQSFDFLTQTAARLHMIIFMCHLIKGHHWIRKICAASWFKCWKLIKVMALRWTRLSFSSFFYHLRPFHFHNILGIRHISTKTCPAYANHYPNLFLSCRSTHLCVTGEKLGPGHYRNLTENYHKDIIQYVRPQSITIHQYYCRNVVNIYRRTKFTWSDVGYRMISILST